MTTFNTTIPTTVSIKVQGHEAEIDVTEIPNDMLAVMVAYGIRRKYQDSINSIAKDLRDNGDDVDGETLFNDFHERVLESELGMRGESANVDPLDAYRKSIVRGIISRDKKSKAYKHYAAIDSSDQKARGEFLLAIAAKNAERIDPIAQSEYEADKAREAELAAVEL